MGAPGNEVRRARGRRIALLCGCVVAAAIALPAWQWIRALRGQPVELIDKTADIQAALTTRQLEARGLALAAGAESARAPLQRRPMTREEVLRVFPLTDILEFDPISYYRLASNQKLKIAWPEHPRGFWMKVTNADGARELHDFPVPPPDCFVLVAGDSHTEGVCSDEESYANRLEALLAQKHPDRRIEAYNCGVATYSFFQYLGTLEKYLERKPDVFVSTFFGGNDFLEVVKIENFFRGTSMPPRTQDYYIRLMKAKKLSEPAMSQGINQVLYFSSYPDQCERALEAAIFACLEIQRVCTEHGIPWIAVYLPSPIDMPFPDWKDLRSKAAGELALSEADLSLNNRMADALISRLREKDVEVLDLRKEFAVDRGPYYWTDLHINLRGHQTIAELLAPRVEAILRRQQL